MIVGAERENAFGEQSGDFYLLNPPRQPKREIADYVESQGILVPRRFESFEEARLSGKPFIVRSEHPQDYNGVSDILGSIRSRYIPPSETEAELRQNMLAGKRYGDYCGLLGIEPEQFEKEASQSYWELLGGSNVTIAADSSIEGRFIVIARDDRGAGCSVVESGKTILQYGFSFSNQSLERLIETYERIRMLPHFDKRHCPAMEFQVADDSNYFLQYHRVRNFSPVGFQLNREPQGDEVEALFVRGATPPQGFTVDATLFYGVGFGEEVKKLPENEQASFDPSFQVARAFSEIMSRKRKLQVIHKFSFLKDTMLDLAGHLLTSRILKPEVSIICAHDVLYAEKEYWALREEAARIRQDVRIRLHVVSDGRKAYIKRIE